MDCAYQRWCSSKRFVLQPYDRWLEKLAIIDRRVLADIAMHDAVAFAALAEKAKGALAACLEIQKRPLLAVFYFSGSILKRK